MAVSNVELRVNATQAVAALNRVNKGATTFNRTVNGTSGQLKQANKGFSILPPALVATGAGAKVAAGGFATLQAALAPILAPLIGLGAAIGTLTASFGILAKQDFSEAKLNTLGVNVDELTPKLSVLSNELSGQASALDLLSASYDVASAGFGETAELLDVLKASQLGATGGFSDLATVADATTSVLNAYGLESDKAAKLVDGFIQTQNDGKIVVDQYAQQIGRLAPIAAGAGVSIDELNAAISAVTATGVPVESTFAGLRQVIASIQKPTGEASKVAKELGIEFNAAAINSKGLSGVLEDIIASGGASQDKLAKLFGSVEALTAIQPLLNDELVKFNEALENQVKSQGNAERAAFTAGNTINGQLKRLSSAFTNLVADGSEFGIVIRETLKITAVTVEALGLAVKATFAPFRALFAFIGEISNAVIGEFGGEAIDIVIAFEKAWIFVKDAIAQSTENLIKLGRKAGSIIGKVIKVIFDGLRKIKEFVEGNPVLNFLLGQIEKITPKIEIEIESEDLDNLNKDLEKTNKRAEELKEAFKKIGENIEQSIVSNLADAVEGTKTLAEAAVNVLNKLKRALIELAIQQAVSGIGNFLGNALGGIFAGGFGGGGGGLNSQALGRAASRQTNIPMNLPAGSFNITPKANGGPVSAGGSYLVGERGPELFSPRSSGMITANEKLGGSTVNNMITVNVDASGSSVEANEGQANAFGAALGAAIQAELIAQKRAGGLLSNA